MNILRIFSKWYNHSSVRSSPRRLLSSDNQNRFFSSKLAPVLSHPVICSLPDSDIRKIEVQLLYYYLHFTEYLETYLVNKAILSIINDEYPLLKFSPELKHEAYKIYCDEAYHSLQSNDMICQVKAASGQEPLDLPIALKSRLDDLKNNFPKDLISFFDLFFVCVSETLVSQELREHIRDTTIHPGIQDIMRDHARDEATHALFFKEVMIALKSQLSSEGYQNFEDHVPLFLEAYLVPSRPNLRIIFSPYLSEESIESVLNDMLNPHGMETFVANSSTMLRRTLNDIAKNGQDDRR